MAVSVRGYKYDESSFAAANWSVKPASGDTLYIINWYGSSTSISGWTLSFDESPTTDQKIKIWTRTADGTSTDLGSSITGYRIGLATIGSTSIDGTVTAINTLATTLSGSTFSAPAPNGGNNPSSTDALFLNIFEFNNTGFYDVPTGANYDGPGDVTNPDLAKKFVNNFNYPTVTNFYFYDEYYSSWWVKQARSVWAKQLYTSTNPGAQTYTLIPFGSVTTFSTITSSGGVIGVSFFIKNNSSLNYGPSIRRF